MPESLLQIRNLTKRFGKLVAVDDLDLEVRAGEVIGLLGVNGAGKTTVMNMILGLTIPNEGTITVFGKDLQKHRIEILKRTNFCTTYANLPSNLKVRQNLRVFAGLYGVKNPGDKIDELLEMLGIAHLRESVTGRLSAGEGTRVNLAKALLNDPELLLLDEPTASLDPDIADKVRSLVRRTQRERSTAILYTSHNMKDIEVVCDRIIFLHEGSILAEGTAAEIKERFSGRDLDEVFIKVARNEVEALRI
ncbi:MAG: ABC transporter ATP-binding protein [Roseibacillus sp.]|jgi:ABC-2 type transport system ATP-binding protein|nr:ABC transporter ATP-binding protein [Roseibacillus sp.]MBP35401.1 ABC transporter ATP-binding protein [Roseibacillus sp.]MCP4730480.1 ABC transporter ATP-binding protein [Roseibacillus sp.]MDP7106398.1 ABC transporter ATP-binding protein [Roseibacillus sp.]MDP7309073.1 ABC transporter ATP-binding protein [Roseibacillus sp.]|tara:strand:+ start:33737 stop:34483 length:747 start_codon:yes stop_codon:yes gene_type:complete